MISNNLQGQLLQVLYKLQKRLQEKGLPEKYEYFSTHSDKGENCTYALKSKQVFYSQDYKDVRDLIIETLNIINKMEATS